MRVRLLSVIAVAAVALTLAFAVTSDAAPRFNAGSRGMRTFSAPPPTTTAPRGAAPVQRSMTQPGQPGSTFARPGTTAPQTGGFFSRGGLLGGLAAGFLGAGLIGMLMGHGFLGGIAGFAGFLGLIAQIALVVIVARLAWAWWQRRSQPASAYAGHDAQMNGARPQNGASFFDAAGHGAADGAPIEIKPDDYTAFEDTLRDVQAAYSKEDVGKLGKLVTPEMLSYYAEELAANASRGVRNEISGVKLLQGDLSESWREGQDEYATVAMRYSLNDKMVDRASGRVVEEQPSEATELWTFRRLHGGEWVLSAIQQTE
jgi:predicted lipid-binding transport protein (Tim44 family)